MSSRRWSPTNALERSKANECWRLPICKHRNTLLSSSDGDAARSNALRDERAEIADDSIVQHCGSVGSKAVEFPSLQKVRRKSCRSHSQKMSDLENNDTASVSDCSFVVGVEYTTPNRFRCLRQTLKTDRIAEIELDRQLSTQPIQSSDGQEERLGNSLYKITHEPHQFNGTTSNVEMR